MHSQQTTLRTPQASRRAFLKQSLTAVAGTGLAGSLSVAPAAHAASREGTGRIRVALIGCGGRGTGAVANALRNAARVDVKLVAMADAFSVRLENSLRSIQRVSPQRVDVPEERRFVGLDAYQKAIDSGVDMVLRCTPPGFRPIHFEAAVKAGKHVFMEKPVAVDAAGVRRVLAANAEAKKKELAVSVGFHLRHAEKYRHAVQRIHDGAIGPVQFLRAYFCAGDISPRRRKAGQTEMQYQVQNWYFFTWLSGDHIVEQHVHDLDVCNWIMQGHPVEAQGMGGRQVRGGKDEGEIYDHHCVEYTYAGGAKLFSFSRQIPRCWNGFAQHAHGTKGHVDLDGRRDNVLHIEGQSPQRSPGPGGEGNGHQLEHDHLFAAIRDGRPYNEGDYGALSTMTAILGRMATYSGKPVTWEEGLGSKRDLSPTRYAWDAEPPAKPRADGSYACAIPGVTKVV